MTASRAARCLKVLAERLLITCEHGGNTVPPRHAALFRGKRRLLESHRGWDPGALLLARELAAALDAELIASTTTRLLVDLNRSPGHPNLFSRISAACDAETKAEILARHYLPYRHQVEEFVATAARNAGRVLHLSVHSFVPRLAGEGRRADIGLLYDPARPAERRFCLRLQTLLRDADPVLIARRNYPYRGTADGLTTFLRHPFSNRFYAGIELEVNQKYSAGLPQHWSALRRSIIHAVRDAYARPLSEGYSS